MERRFPVIGYGSNPVPGQLVSKFGGDCLVPVVRGQAQKCDVVYNLISNMGYAFAELHVDASGAACADVSITFLDDRQLQMMIETEQNYVLAYSPRDVLLENGQFLSGGLDGYLYVFAGFRKIWVPRHLPLPVGVADLPSSSRVNPELTQEATLELVVSEFGLQECGIASADDLSKRIRNEAALSEGPEKLKYRIQRAVQNDPRSLAPLAQGVATVGSDPIRRLGDN